MSIIERLDLVARQEIWSNSRQGRLMAGQLLAIGEMLDTQQLTLRLQGRLCRIAASTNSLLSGIAGDLSELSHHQQKANELLNKSLTLQQEHLEVIRRERVLKDALFRWEEIFDNSQHGQDPHWQVIAARTLSAFMEQWKFSTQDLAERAEKRRFVDLVAKASRIVDSSDLNVRHEVNVFQAVYAELVELLDAASQEHYDAAVFRKQVGQMIAPHFAEHETEVRRIVLSHVGRHMEAGREVRLDSDRQRVRSRVEEIAQKIAKQSERKRLSNSDTSAIAYVTGQVFWQRFGDFMLLPGIGGTSLVKEVLLAFYTSFIVINPNGDGWTILAWDDLLEPLNLQLLRGFATGRLEYPASDFAERRGGAVAAAVAWCEYWCNTIRETGKVWARVASDAQAQRTQKIEASAEQVNSYLAIHPGVAEFYPPRKEAR